MLKIPYRVRHFLSHWLSSEIWHELKATIRRIITEEKCRSRTLDSYFYAEKWQNKKKRPAGLVISLFFSSIRFYLSKSGSMTSENTRRLIAPWTCPSNENDDFYDGARNLQKLSRCLIFRKRTSKHLFVSVYRFYIDTQMTTMNGSRSPFNVRKVRLALAQTVDRSKIQ